MNTLIIKLNATGDVVRTTTLLHVLSGEVTWITARDNLPLLQGIADGLRSFAWEDRALAMDRSYDLVINLEDELDTAAFAEGIRTSRRFGAILAGDDGVGYTDDARGWFDMSLISVHGRQRADEIKYRNRKSYQELVFSGLGRPFDGETYLLPEPVDAGLHGDVAVAPVAGPVWPMKNWAFYDEAMQRLTSEGFRVNVLPRRPSLLEHLGDIRNHRCLLSGDSLPMHFALGLGIPCVTIFNCTSPWEIHDYGLQTKIISPLLGEFFYKRGADSRATAAVTVDDVVDAVRAKVDGSEQELRRAGRA